MKSKENRRPTADLPAPRPREELWKQMEGFRKHLKWWASQPHQTAHGPTAGVPDVPGPGSGEAGQSQISMIIMDGYDSQSRCAQLIIGAAWAYSAPAVGLPQTPRAPCPNEKFWKTLESENNTWNDSRNIWNGNYKKLWKGMKTHDKRPNTMKNK